jgi:putative flavoprotein involved in K+ transport
MHASTPAAKIRQWLAEFERHLRAGDIAAAIGLFAQEQSFWRDLTVFTWNLKTMEGRSEIAAFLAATLARVRPHNFGIDGEAGEVDGCSEARLTFETRHFWGRGHLRLRDGKCWTLLTSAHALKGHEEMAGRRRENGVTHGVAPGRKSWLELHQEEEAELGFLRQPYCVIVGGGQGGIALAARLRRLGVPTIVLEKNARAGDSWRKRYQSLCLHDPVWYDHLPYLPFPDHWPVFSPKDKLGDWLEMYVKVMELNYWTSAPCLKAAYDETTKEWSVLVNRGGKLITLRPRHLVLATGMSGFPEVPKIEGRDSFKGEQHHSSCHRSGATYAGKRCVVLGSNNSAHDIAADLWEHGADVTMVQRSPTVVVRSETLIEKAHAPLYSEAALEKGISTEIADLMLASLPHRLVPERARPLYAEIRERDQSLYDRLQKAGFQFNFGEDGTGIHCIYARRGSGYYIDVGASELIADGRIKLKSRVTVESITPDTVVLSDGSALPADLIVYATGYGSMNEWAAELISAEVADKVGKCWGLGSGTNKDPGPWEGELRNMWRPTQQEALWFHGGNLQQSRFYSLQLALQIKARAVGIETPVWGLQPVHHRR